MQWLPKGFRRQRNPVELPGTTVDPRTRVLAAWPWELEPEFDEMMETVFSENEQMLYDLYFKVYD